MAIDSKLRACDLVSLKGLSSLKTINGSLIIGSGIGIYYYLRVVFYMTRRPEEHSYLVAAPGGWHIRAISCALIASILLLGTVPQPLMEYLRSILN